ncbi:unnamed protein product [Sphacelaria rigidula]
MSMTRSWWVMRLRAPGWLQISTVTFRRKLLGNWSCIRDASTGTTSRRVLQRILDRFPITRTAATHVYVSPPFKVDEGEDLRGRYRKAVGSLTWVSTDDRPDIAYAVRAASRQNKNPTPEDWRNMLRI